MRSDTSRERPRESHVGERTAEALLIACRRGSPPPAAAMGAATR